MIMSERDEEFYQALYEKIYEDCPEEVWEDFIGKMKNQSELYRASLGEDFIEKIREESSEEDTMILEDILTGISIRRIQNYRRFSPRSRHEKFMKRHQIPHPPEEVRQTLRTLPGATTKAKRAYEREQEIIDGLDKSQINREYSEGLSISEIARRKEVDSYIIKGLITSELRMTTNELNEKTLRILGNRPISWYREVFEENPDWSLEDLKEFVVQEVFKGREYSDKALIPFFQENGINTTKKRRRAARKRKSRTKANTAWMVKQTSVELITKSKYKSIDELTKQYCNDQIGTYRQVAANLNKELKTEHFTPRQIEKLVTSNNNYFRRRSRTESIFIEEVKKVLNLSEGEIKRDYIFDPDTSSSTVDLYIPELEVAFEFNGDYWHSNEVISHNYGITDIEFHQRKREGCRDVGIELMYVWENDFEDDPEGVLELIKEKNFDHPTLSQMRGSSKRTNFSAPSNRTRKILSTLDIPFVKKGKFFEVSDFLVKDASKRLSNHSFIEEAREMGKELLIVYPWYDASKVRQFIQYKSKRAVRRVPARKCEVEVDDRLTKEDREFIEENHILGSYSFRKVIKVVRLLYQEEVVAMSVFTEYNDETAELKRMVFKYGTSVMGGASRMIIAFEREGNEYKTLMTFSDNDLGEGGVYKTIGFDLVEESKGNPVYFHPRTRQKFSHKSLYMIGADRLLKNHPRYKPVGMGEGLPSNTEIVESHGFQRYMDGGYKKWVKSLRP